MINFEAEKQRIAAIKSNKETVERIKELCKIKRIKQGFSGSAFDAMLDFLNRDDIKNFYVTKTSDPQYPDRSLRGLKKRNDPRHWYDHGFRLSGARWILFNKKK